MELGDGLAYEDTVPGTGRECKTGDTVVVHATGTFTDGKKFWSSHDDGEKVFLGKRGGSLITITNMDRILHRRSWQWRLGRDG